MSKARNKPRITLDALDAVQVGDANLSGPPETESSERPSTPSDAIPLVAAGVMPKGVSAEVAELLAPPPEPEPEIAPEPEPLEAPAAKVPIPAPAPAPRRTGLWASAALLILGGTAAAWVALGAAPALDETSYASGPTAVAAVQAPAARIGFVPIPPEPEPVAEEATVDDRPANTRPRRDRTPQVRGEDLF